MAANIVEATNPAIFAADDDERIGIHLEREVMAGSGDLARMPGEKPAGVPDALQVGAIDGFVRIELAWQ